MVPGLQYRSILWNKQYMELSLQPTFVYEFQLFLSSHSAVGLGVLFWVLFLFGCLFSWSSCWWFLGSFCFFGRFLLSLFSFSCCFFSRASWFAFFFSSWIAFSWIPFSFASRASFEVSRKNFCLWAVFFFLMTGAGYERISESGSPG